MKSRAVLLALVLAGGLCAPAWGSPSDDHDPLEGFNRKMFWFNDHVDVYVLEPTARAWAWVAPQRMRTSVANFFANLRFPVVAANDLLQGKMKAGAVDVGRFGVNTTVGLAGFFDPASSWGLEKHVEDFGQTLGVWGVPTGPYLVLPLLGPSSPRDATGLVADYAFSVTPFFIDQFILLGARVGDTVNDRAAVLNEVRDLKRSALDYYVSVRNAYFQRRTALVSDNAEPTTGEEDDLYNPNLGNEQ